ncbi:MAG: site-2 protease family protein [Desulfopila sp.]
MNSFITELILLTPPILLALTFHEFAHGYVAYRLGDPTARMAGRLTLNPLKHLDPLGTLAFFIIKLGWAKPVPVNPAYFRNPKKDMLWVALAGPLANATLAVVSAMLAKFVWLVATILPATPVVGAILLPLNSMLITSVWINLVLCIFNFLPIPPLDGSKILMGVLPDRSALAFMQLEKYGFILILLLAFTGVLSQVIVPIISFVNRLLLA